MKKSMALAISLALFVYIFDETVNEQILNTYEKQLSIAGAHENIVLGNLDTRIGLWERIRSYLSENPKLVLTGTGFQNLWSFFPIWE